MRSERNIFRSVTECMSGKYCYILEVCKIGRNLKIVCLCRWVRERFEDENYAKLIGKF